METEYATLPKEQANGETIHLSREKLVSLVSQAFGRSFENPNPDEPSKPGPWDPVIRKVARQVFGPSPEPWRSEFNVDRLILGIIAARHPAIYDVICGGRFDWAALNPQPLPPQVAFVVAFTEEVIDRLLLMQDLADAINQTGEQQGIIIVSGRLSLLVDELCGNNFKIKIPIPHPKHETDDRLSGLELMMAGLVCEQASVTIANERLQQELRNAAGKLIETGIDRI